MISNVFTYKIINKTVKDFNSITIKLEKPNGIVKLVGNTNIKIPAEKTFQGTLFIEIKATEVNDDKMKIKLGFYNNGKLIETTKTTFLGPRTFN